MSCSRGFHSSLYSAKIVVEKVPALGESITEGSIASWAKKEGDAVAVDDVIVIVETDKVTVDIKSTFAGVFKKKLVTDNVRFFEIKVFQNSSNFFPFSIHPLGCCWSASV